MNNNELYLLIQIYNSHTVQPCIDSSRYFVIRVQYNKSQYKMIGLGFNKREDSFEFKSIMQDVLNGQRNVADTRNYSNHNDTTLVNHTDPVDHTTVRQPSIDLSLQNTIHINLPNTKTTNSKSVVGTINKTQSLHDAVAALGLQVPHTSKHRITNHNNTESTPTSTNVHDILQLNDDDNNISSSISGTTTPSLDDPFTQLRSDATKPTDNNTTSIPQPVVATEDWVAF